MITSPPSGPHADARNIVIIGKGQLGLNQIFRHESSIHSVFKGGIVAETFVGDKPAIIPRISCRPFLTGFHQFVIDYDDPFAEGFVL